MPLISVNSASAFTSEDERAGITPSLRQEWRKRNRARERRAGAIDVRNLPDASQGCENPQVPPSAAPHAPAATRIVTVRCVPRQFMRQPFHLWLVNLCSVLEDPLPDRGKSF